MDDIEDTILKHMLLDGNIALHGVEKSSRYPECLARAKIWDGHFDTEFSCYLASSDDFSSFRFV
jgi:hypothetical protein